MSDAPDASPVDPVHATPSEGGGPDAFGPTVAPSPPWHGSLLVALQFTLLVPSGLLGAVSLWTGRANAIAWTCWVLCLALAIASLRANPPGNFRIRPVPRPGARLVVDGPYRWIRHPMYTSLLLFAAGNAAAAGGIAALLGHGLAAVLVRKALVEERALTHGYAGYAAYRRRTWHFVPWLY